MRSSSGTPANHDTSASQLIVQTIALMLLVNLHRHLQHAFVQAHTQVHITPKRKNHSTNKWHFFRKGTSAGINSCAATIKTPFLPWQLWPHSECVEHGKHRLHRALTHNMSITPPAPTVALLLLLLLLPLLPLLLLLPLHNHV